MKTTGLDPVEIADHRVGDCGKDCVLCRRCGETEWGRLGDRRCILEENHSPSKPHTDGKVRW